MSKQNISRLKETAFSHYNLRDAYIQDIPEYLVSLRDEAIFSNFSVKVLIKIPVDPEGKLNENNVSEYSDFVDIEWRETTECVVPLFKEYRQNLSEEGLTADGTDGLYPLEVILPSKLHIPRNSRLIFSEYNSREEKISREWTILGTVSKQLSNSKTYTRIARCVPSRQCLFTTSEVARGTLWFDYLCGRLSKETSLRCHGTLWFLRLSASKGCVSKVLPDYIREQVDDYPIIEEKILPIYYYDSRPERILDKGSGFKIGKGYDVRISGTPVKVLNEKEEEVTLQLIPLEVDSEGGLIKFAYSIERGLTEINENVAVENATIELNATTFTKSVIAETIDLTEIENAKFLHPYELESYFTGKKIMVSVLN